MRPSALLDLDTLVDDAGAWWREFRIASVWSIELQPMKEFRLHSGHCPHGRPEGARRLDIDTDYGAFPVWTWFTLPAMRDLPPREACVSASPTYLRISAELATDLRARATWQDEHQHAAWRSPNNQPEASTEKDWRRWHANGRALAERLAETGDEVVYGWPSEGRDPECPHCGSDRPPQPGDDRRQQ